MPYALLLPEHCALMKQKVLLARFSSIGDIIITTPIIRALAQKYPSWEIHFATKKAYAPLLQHNPYLSSLHLLDNRFRGFISQLQNENFDLFIDLHVNLRTSMLARFLGAKLQFSYQKGNVLKWLTVNHSAYQMPMQHTVYRYFDALKTLEITYDHEGYDLFFPAEDQVTHHQYPEPYLCYAIGGKFNTKQLDLDNAVKLCRNVHAKVLLLGGEEDLPFGEAIAKQTENTVNLAGTTSLLQSARLMDNSVGVIAHDTGLMHMAAALRKPICSIWGSTVTALGFYPLQHISVEEKSILIENVGLSCRPCHRHGRQVCPKGHFACMRKLDVSHAWKWANQLLR